MLSDRESALAAFDRAHADFAVALENTPVAALRFRPAGEDYALGGLAIHVAQVLEKYVRVLAAMRAADDQPAMEPPPPADSQADAALVRDGFDEATRASVLERVREAHASLVQAVRAVPNESFHRAVPVTYAGAAEPFATSAADVLGWVHDHYAEHVRQVTELLAVWAPSVT